MEDGNAKLGFQKECREKGLKREKKERELTRRIIHGGNL